LENFFLEKGAEEGARFIEMVITPHIGQKRALCLPLVIMKKYGADSFQPIRHKERMKSFLLKKPMNVRITVEIYNFQAI